MIVLVCNHFQFWGPIRIINGNLIKTVVYGKPSGVGNDGVLKIQNSSVLSCIQPFETIGETVFCSCNCESGMSDAKQFWSINSPFVLWCHPCFPAKSIDSIDQNGIHTVYRLMPAFHENHPIEFTDWSVTTWQFLMTSIFLGNEIDEP